MILTILTVALLIALVVGLLQLSYTVPQQQIYIVERLGRFSGCYDAGLHFKLPYVDKIAAKVDMRVMQINTQINTKTKDNVFVDLKVAVQYRVDAKNVPAAYYELSNPIAQINAYIEDSIRNIVPGLSLDETFEQKDNIANQVLQTLTKEMQGFGYLIVKTLLTDVSPDKRVADAMNSINEANRKRVAAQELAEADKIAVVVKAEAEAEEMRLHGEGIANQRKAVVDGLAQSMEELKVNGMSETEIMAVLLTSQYLDTLNEFAQSNSTKVLMMPSGPVGSEDIRNSMVQALETAKWDHRVVDVLDQ